MGTQVTSAFNVSNGQLPGSTFFDSDLEWNELKAALKSILVKEHSNLSYEKLYRKAYNIAMNRRGELVFKGHKELLVDYAKTAIMPKLLTAQDLLNDLAGIWNEYSTAVGMMRDILLYLDRASASPHITIYQQGFTVFREEVVDRPPINERMKDALLDMITREREKEIIDWITFKSIVRMFLAIGDRVYYEKNFEGPFLRLTRQFCRRLANTFMAENSCIDYIMKVNECFAEENNRAQRYLDQESQNKLNKVLLSEFVTEKNIVAIIRMENSGLVFMIENNLLEELQQLYNFVQQLENGTRVIETIFSEYIQLTGLAIVNGIKNGSALNPTDFVQNIIDLKTKLDKIVTESFNNNKMLKRQVPSGFEYFLNESVKMPEYVSLYIDEKLKKGSKGINEPEIEAALENAMALFKLLQEKDLFEKYYTQHLAKRLLLNRSASEETEKLMISKLKSECGCQFTSKLEGMFQDIQISNSLNAEYKAKVKMYENIELCVSVLKGINWPFNITKQCPLPGDVGEALQAFQAFYISKHEGRKLTLNPCLGNADVNATFYNKENGSGQASTTHGTPKIKEVLKILNVSTYHMIVLMCFNHTKALTFQQLFEKTEIPESELRKCIQALAMGKQSQRILCRVGTTKEIENGDVFTVNDDFASKFTRIKVQAVTGRSETDAEATATRNKVNDDRKYEVEAAIVRVLKTRKQITHSDLFQEVSKQLKSRFGLEASLLKSRIESLIDREYLERDEDNNNVYKYLA
ncbi:cullin family domain-containing protein [Ditylenchus destructor]|uniref:Cullin family domain-containing protein n=1 Tax=Ditylenchus destructor TaxID=166010 RepID=A0AAD4R9D2_9BILA|nr:cullin family domain-containing protein [Ditylenchus destructor]